MRIYARDRACGFRFARAEWVRVSMNARPPRGRIEGRREVVLAGTYPPGVETTVDEHKGTQAIAEPVIAIGEVPRSEERPARRARSSGTSCQFS